MYRHDAMFPGIMPGLLFKAGAITCWNLCCIPGQWLSLKSMVEYAAWKRRPPRIVTRFPVNRKRVERIISRHLRIGRYQIGEVDAKEIFSAFEFSVPAGYLAISVEDAVESATRIGYPVAIVGTIPEAHGEDIIAVGVYYLDPKINRAEVAFIVRDDWQNRGIGSFLLNYLITIAKRNGIAGLTAETLRENKSMQAVFEKADCKVQMQLSGGVYSYQLEFE